MLAHYAAFKMGGSVYPRDGSRYDDRTFDDMPNLVEASKYWRSKATALLSVVDEMLPPGTRLYGQALIAAGF